MNKIKNDISFKFEKPIRKNSEDFDDSDISIDSDFSFDQDINNNNFKELSNGKSNDDINLLKQGLLIKNDQEKEINSMINNENKENNENNLLSNDNNDELYSDKEEYTEESNEESDQKEQSIKEKNVVKNKNNSKNSKTEKENNNKDKNSLGSINNDNDSDKDKIRNKSDLSEKGSETERNEKIEKDLINSITKKEMVTREKIQLAESIKFKDEPDKIIITDEYGFIKKTVKNNKNNVLEERDRRSRRDSEISKTLLQINARMEKWNYMLQNYEEFSKVKKKKMLLKSRTRKGIPDNLRGYAWQLFAEKDKFYVKDLYQNLEKEPVKEKLELVIIKDLDRTFPTCQFFKERYGNGQRKLYKVLSAYSKYNKSVGYVQGMGFITAIFLIYMDEESSFYMLHSLMKKYKLEGLYYDGFPELKKKCYVFLNMQKKYINNSYKIFRREGIIPTMYLSSWFISLFSRTLKFHMVLRIFDCFFLEGFKVIYRIALAILKLNESNFSKAPKGEVIPLIYQCHENIDIEELFKVAFGFNISRAYIEKCEEEYEKVKDDEKNEFISQLCW